MKNLPGGDPLSLVTPISDAYFNYTVTSQNEKQETSVKGMLGKHLVIHDIKYGGMGEVFLCSFQSEQDKKKGATVAMKSFQKQFFFDPLYRISFENEAVNWSRLSGLPHIMPVLKIEEIDNRIFLMLPCVNNANKINTLRDELNTKTIDIRGKLRHFLQSLLGMLYVSQRFDGLSHGDIKPENMMILNHHVYITDFGLSKTVEDFKNPQVKINLETTWAYKAPELWTKTNSQSVKSDIYAFGVILYEILAGKLPFAAANRADWEDAHSNAVPAGVTFSRRTEDYRGFLEIALKCLNKNPEERPGYPQLYDEYNKCWEKIDILDYLSVIYDQLQIQNSFSSLQKLAKLPIIQGLIKLERSDLALLEIENLEPESFTPQLLHAKGTALSLMNRDEEAITVFKEILVQDIPKDLKIECLNELGLSYKRTKRFREAEKIYLDNLIPIISNRQVPKIITNLGTVYLYEKKYDKVIQCLQPMLRDYPETFEGWANLGYAYESKKDYENAIDCFKKTLVLKPRLSSIQVELARVYLRTGLAEEAYALLDSAWSQGYNTIHWLQNMIIACFVTKREDDLAELVNMTKKEFGEEKANEIFKSVTEDIKNMLEEYQKRTTKKEDADENAPAIEKEEPEATAPADGETADDQNNISSSPAGFSMPFLNYRLYMDDNSYSIDFYYPTSKTDAYVEEFRKSYRMAKNDPRIKSGNMKMRSTFFYFTECPECSLEILTNRDIGKPLACRRCDFRSPTAVKSNSSLDKLLEECLKAVELKIEKNKGQSILMIVQPGGEDDIDLLKNIFLNDGYTERQTGKDKQVLYLFEGMVNRKLFTRHEKILAFNKDFPAEIVSYKEQTPVEVEQLLRELRSHFPHLRSASATYETHPDDLQNLMLMGKDAEALEKLEDELRDDPGDYHLLALKAFLLCELGKAQEARLIASELLKTNTNRADAWLLMGETLVNVAEFEQAISYLEQASRMEPMNPSPLVKLLTCYKNTANKKELDRVILKLKSLGTL